MMTKPKKRNKPPVRLIERRKGPLFLQDEARDFKPDTWKLNSCGTYIMGLVIVLGVFVSKRSFDH